MMNNVTVISAMGDNFIYLCRYAQGKAFVVDPGDARSVEAEIQKQALKLTHILLTHHHFDHTGGVAELKTRYDCEVVGSTHSSVRLGGIEIEIIATPGHTKDGVCYYVSDGQEKAVFTGDTLFVGGCGRPMEASRQVMWKSLEKLAALPDESSSCRYYLLLTVIAGQSSVLKGEAGRPSLFDRLQAGLCAHA